MLLTSHRRLQPSPYSRVCSGRVETEVRLAMEDILFLARSVDRKGSTRHPAASCRTSTVTVGRRRKHFYRTLVVRTMHQDELLAVKEQLSPPIAGRNALTSAQSQKFPSGPACVEPDLLPSLSFLLQPLHHHQITPITIHQTAYNQAISHNIVDSNMPQAIAEL